MRKSIVPCAIQEIKYRIYTKHFMTDSYLFILCLKDNEEKQMIKNVGIQQQQQQQNLLCLLVKQ